MPFIERNTGLLFSPGKLLAWLKGYLLRLAGRLVTPTLVAALVTCVTLHPTFILRITMAVYIIIVFIVKANR